MKSRILTLLCIIASFSIPAFGQTTPPVLPGVQTWSLTSSAIALPGSNDTLAASMSGFTFTPDPDFDIRQTDIVSGAGFTGFFGGLNYRLPVISTKPVNGKVYRFQPYITASVGVDRVVDASGSARQHWAFLLGGGINYDLTQSGSWTLGAEAQYAKLPGRANNTAIVAFGPAFHF